jgi:NAD(P)-dependent dehydrogenase (short-subunit alcohol dehydrogenase family)
VSSVSLQKSIAPCYFSSPQKIFSSNRHILSFNMDFKDKVVIITGSSSGIGRGAAELLSKQGASVVITGRNIDGLDQTEEKCSGEVLKIVADLKNEADCVKIIDKTVEKFGKIDVLVNNAGVGVLYDEVINITMEDFDNVMNVNLRAVFFLTKLAIPHLIKTQGNIVNVSSIAGLRPYATLTPYGMTKAALDQFTKCLSLELASNKVRVNSINPAVISTNFHNAMGLTPQTYKDYIEQCKTTHPIGRVGTIEDTAHAIAFLASPQATFITGVTLPVDGGRFNASR